MKGSKSKKVWVVVLICSKSRKTYVKKHIHIKDLFQIKEHFSLKEIKYHLFLCVAYMNVRNNANRGPPPNVPYVYNAVFVPLIRQNRTWYSNHRNNDH